MQDNDDVSMMCLFLANSYYIIKRWGLYSRTTAVQDTLTLYPQMHLITKTNGRHERPLTPVPIHLNIMIPKQKDLALLRCTIIDFQFV